MYKRSAPARSLGGDDGEDFRERVAEWLRTAAPAPGSTSLPSRHDEERFVAASRQWQGVLAAAGWAGLAWPERFGGRGATADHVRIFAEEASRFPVTNVALGVGLEMVAPALMAHGSEAQQAVHLPRILRGEELWCQLFSEPGAGSDLASLATTARRDGADWVLDGQKVWTTRAHVADFGLLLARTDQERARHRGITAFVVDMRTDGIETRPIRQIDGGREFNEVFFTGARIPGASVIGEVDDGWRVAMTMLGSERAYIGTTMPDDELDALVDRARRDIAPRRSTRRQLVDVVIARTVIGYLGGRVLAAQAAGSDTASVASVLKLAVCRYSSELAELAIAVDGMAGVAVEPGLEVPSGQRLLLSQWAVRIGGGTEQIQRNIIGERILGLPR